MSEISETDVVEHVSPVAFAATVERLVNAIKSHGLILFAEIDHTENARESGLSMPPATVLIYGHAKGGTPVMLAAPLAALDLPLHVLVYEKEDGRTAIAFHPVASVLRRVGISETLAARLEPAQQMLVVALVL